MNSEGDALDSDSPSVKGKAPVHSTGAKREGQAKRDKDSREPKRQSARHFPLDSKHVKESFPFVAAASHPSPDVFSSTNVDICCFLLKEECTQGCPSTGIFCAPCVVRIVQSRVES